MLYFRLGSGNGEKNEKYRCRKYNGNKDQVNEKSSIVLEIAKALNCSGSYLLEGKKAEALDARIMDALLELKNDQMREVALKQIQALALLG